MDSTPLIEELETYQDAINEFLAARRERRLFAATHQLSADGSAIEPVA